MSAGGRLAEIEAALRQTGLMARGAFNCVAADGVPDQPDGRPSRSVVLAGNVGGSLWSAFADSPEARDGRSDPMNRWSARTVGAVAAQVGGLAVFPFGGPPYLPFLRWAEKADQVAPSPLGMLIHPQFGLWHAYRGAIALAEALPLPPRASWRHPCDDCADKPCLTTCPAGAFTASGYDVAACAAHVAAPQGADCLETACRARRACPVGRGYRYEAGQARFHMQAFIAARGDQYAESGSPRNASESP